MVIVKEEWLIIERKSILCLKFIIKFIIIIVDFDDRLSGKKLDHSMPSSSPSPSAVSMPTSS